MTPDRSLLSAIERFYNVQEIRYIREWLVKERDSEMAKAIKAVENSDVARGRAQMLMELVNIIETAPQELQRLEKRDGKRNT